MSPLRPRLATLLLAAFVLGPWSLVISARAQPAPAAAVLVPTELRSEKLQMTSTDDETTAVATGNVILTGTNLRITCDQLTLVATRIGDKDATIGAVENFKYILATGNVRIVQGDRESTSQRAEVFPREDKVVLSESPVIIDHSNGFAGAGEKITLFRGKREVFIEQPRFTGPPVGDLGATAGPRTAAPAAKPAPSAGVTFPKPAAK